MNKLVLLTLAALALPGQAHALVIELVPLSASVNAQVVAVTNAGMQAVVFTGKAAQSIAARADYVLDTSKQMLVVSGKEIDLLISELRNEVEAEGEVIFFTGLILSHQAYGLVAKAVKNGVRFEMRAIDQVTRAVRLSLFAFNVAAARGVSAAYQAGTYRVSQLKNTYR